MTRPFALALLALLATAATSFAGDAPVNPKINDTTTITKPKEYDPRPQPPQSVQVRPIIGADKNPRPGEGKDGVKGGVQVQIPIK